MVMAGQPWGAGQEAPGGRAHVGSEAAPVTACLMAATTGLGEEMCLCTCLRPSSPWHPEPLQPPISRRKEEEAMANRHLEVPGQNQVMQAEATRSSHHILVTILTIGILLPDLRLLTQVLEMQTSGLNSGV